MSSAFQGHMWGHFFRFESAHIYPNMCAKFGYSLTVMSKKGGGVQTDRQTDTQRDTAALYSRCPLLNYAGIFLKSAECIL